MTAGVRTSTVPIGLVALIAAVAWWSVVILLPVHHVSLTSPSAITPLVMVTLLGGCAGGATAGLRTDRRLHAGVLATVGVTVTALVTLTMTATRADADVRLIGGLWAVAMSATVVGLLLGLLAVFGPTMARGIALAAPAVYGASYLAGLLSLPPTIGSIWLPGLCLGVVLALTVSTSPVSLLGWIPVILTAWTARASMLAFIAVGPWLQAGSSIAGRPGELVGVFGADLGQAWTTVPSRQFAIWGIALTTGLLAAIARLRPRRAVSLAER